VCNPHERCKWSKQVKHAVRMQCSSAAVQQRQVEASMLQHSSRDRHYRVHDLYTAAAVGGCKNHTAVGSAR
jgi:hypothetical protein